MLYGVNPNCPPDLLYCLACMGHGDELMIADRNYPAHAHAAEAAVPQPIALPGFDALAAIKMITELMPIEPHIERQAFYQHAKSVFGIVHTTEDQPFGCYILRKGVIF